MKLISMTDFVLDQNHKWFHERYYFIEKYANFLKQPLELGMFVPCIDNEVFNYSKHGNKEQYQQAKEACIFEGFEIKYEDDFKTVCSYLNFNVCIGYKKSYLGVIKNERIYHRDSIKNIEEIVKYDLYLTQTVIKKIGL